LSISFHYPFLKVSFLFSKIHEITKRVSRKKNRGINEYKKENKSKHYNITSQNNTKAHGDKANNDGTLQKQNG
jgi:hypothetical protein